MPGLTHISGSVYAQIRAMNKSGISVLSSALTSDSARKTELKAQGLKELTGMTAIITSQDNPEIGDYVHTHIQLWALILFASCSAGGSWSYVHKRLWSKPCFWYRACAVRL